MEDKYLNEGLKARLNRLHKKRGLYIQIVSSMIDNDLDFDLILEVRNQIKILSNEIVRIENLLKPEE